MQTGDTGKTGSDARPSEPFNDQVLSSHDASDHHKQPPHDVSGGLGLIYVHYKSVDEPEAMRRIHVSGS